MPGQERPSKTLKLAWSFEPENLSPKFLTGSGVGEYNWVFNSTLTFFDFNGVPHPMLAREIPSQERGDWVINADGTMVTTYRLRENTRWHDGAPLTAHDFAFAHPVYLDRDVPVVDRVPESLMSQVEARDDYTLVITWKEPYNQGNVLGYRQLPPLPRHLLEQKYLTNKANFVFGDEWTTGFVGTGPFRVEHLEPGTSLQARAHPGWALGPPKLDALNILFIADPSTELANLMGGDVDMINSPGARVTEAVVARDQWVSRGEGYLKTWVTRLHFIEFQYRDVPNRQQAISDLKVRQGLLHALDRQGISDAVNQGLATPTDGFFVPTDPLFPEIDRVVAKYPYDPNRASALLGEAGWRRPAPGSPISNAAGQTLDIEVWASAQQQQQATISADNWKSVGINSSFFIVPTARARDEEFVSGFPAAGLNGRTISAENFLFTSDKIPTPEARFFGLNRGGFSDSEVDRNQNVVMTSFNEQERRQANVAVQKRISELAGYGPLIYTAEIILAKNRVKGPVGNYGPQIGITWNVHEWELVD